MRRSEKVSRKTQNIVGNFMLEKLYRVLGRRAEKFIQIEFSNFSTLTPDR